MKNKFLFIVLLCIFSMSLAACKDDDDDATPSSTEETNSTTEQTNTPQTTTTTSDQETNSTSPKNNISLAYNRDLNQIIEIKDSDGYGDKFVYDAEGRLIFTSEYMCTYYEDSAVVKGISSKKDKYSLILNDGHAVLGIRNGYLDDEYIDVFSYTKDWVLTNTYEYDLIYSDGLLTFEYSQIIPNHFSVDLFAYIITDQVYSFYYDYQIFDHLFCRNKQLPTKVKDGDKEISIEYEMDGDYIKTIKVSEDDKTETYEIVYQK